MQHYQLYQFVQRFNNKKLENKKNIRQRFCYVYLVKGALHIADCPNVCLFRTGF